MFLQSCTCCRSLKKPYQLPDRGSPPVALKRKHLTSKIITISHFITGQTNFASQNRMADRPKLPCNWPDLGVALKFQSKMSHDVAVPKEREQTMPYRRNGSLHSMERQITPGIHCMRSKRCQISKNSANAVDRNESLSPIQIRHRIIQLPTIFLAKHVYLNKF